MAFGHRRDILSIQRKSCVFFFVAFFIIVIILSTICIFSFNYNNDLVFCTDGYPSFTRNMDEPGIFNDLTPSEMRAVRNYLFSVPELNLLPIENATLNSSYIFMIDLKMPLKADVLGYINSGRRKPVRAAIAVLYRGDLSPPKVEEHIVGPLPSPTYHSVLINPAYRRTNIPYASRPTDSVERRELTLFLKRETVALRKLFHESYMLSYHDCHHGPHCMVLVDLPPRGLSSGQRMSWFWGYRQVEGASLHPLGFALQVDHISVDVAKWMITGVIYNGQMFYEVEDLADRYQDGSLRKLQLHVDDYDQGFSSFERRGPDWFDAPGRGPRFVEPDGHRFIVDGQFVKYFGWSFNFRSRSSTGLQLFDVFFQDGRLAYEIGLQEAVMFYSGHTPEMSILSFFASSWLLGASSMELVPGVDCPATAHFMDTYHFVDSSFPRRFRSSVCVFELNEGLPLRRHYSYSLDGVDDGRFQYYGGSISYSLVLRTIAVVWNKDFIVDYLFHLDGTLEIKVSTSGHPQTSFALPRERPYGYTVHEHLVGNAFQEFFHFKLDLDIAGRSNRYGVVDLVVSAEKDFWRHRDRNITKTRLVTEVVKTELESLWNLTDSPYRHHIFYNHKLSTRNQHYRGYRLIHKSQARFLLSDADWARAAWWARSPLAVSLYKDVEDQSSSMYAQGDPWSPILDFEMFLQDNQTIVDADLVVWATLGSTVLPVTEDVPSPSTAVRNHRLLLTPHNYFDVGPATVLSEVVRITGSLSDAGTRQDEGLVRSTELKFSGTLLDPPNCVQRERRLDGFSGLVPSVEG